jgi:hypothetical protein
MNDDYQTALEELDREFPGLAYDPSLEEYLEDRRRSRQRLKELKESFFKKGVWLILGVIYWFFAMGTIFSFLWK